MRPVFSFYCFAMFSAPGHDLSTGLTHVLFSTWTVEAVDALLLPFVFFWSAFGGEYVAKLLTTLENYI